MVEVETFYLEPNNWATAPIRDQEVSLRMFEWSFGGQLALVYLFSFFVQRQNQAFLETRDKKLRSPRLV